MVAKGVEAMRLWIYILQISLFVVFVAVTLLEHRFSLTGWWTVLVVGFIGFAGKLYDYTREKNPSS